MNFDAVKSPPDINPKKLSSMTTEVSDCSTKCRFCLSELETTFVDLGMTPLSNDYTKPETFNRSQRFYPLTPYVCARCFLVQLPEYETPDFIFSDYAYFSSYSPSWLEHCRAYVKAVIERFSLTGENHVVEVASNDGYLLQYFQERTIPVLGIEPAKNVAAAAVEKGIPTLAEFFGAELARKLEGEGKQADLIIGNNVLAHVPDLNDFVSGLKVLLKPGGVITMEFPHLVRLIKEKQFDTIYHEHFSYLSLTTVEEVLASKGLRVFDVEELNTHGGSLRIYAAHAADDSKEASRRLRGLEQREDEFGIRQLATYRDFAREVYRVKRQLLELLVKIKNSNARIAGYGAAAKGNTLLNFCGIGTDFLDYVVDRSPHKQGLYLPGTRIPIREPELLERDRPEYVMILPWNLKDEIMEQLAFVRKWGGKFIIPIPEAKVVRGLIE